MKASAEKHTLTYKKPAATSRGDLQERVLWLIYLENNNGTKGVGECGIIPGLSPDDAPNLEATILHTLDRINNGTTLQQLNLQAFPALAFALETAMLDLLHGGKRILFPSAFSKGEDTIPINGLVWMDTKEEMLKEANSKILSGFKCIKFKIGALDFDEECRLLESIRKQHSASELEIRVDANGAFKPDDALLKLKELKKYNLHSIEQPIRQGLHEQMAEICAKSPVAVALDEELIGIENPFKILKLIRPKFIVLKPSLLGGLKRCDDLIKTATENDIGWWATSALESNIGLNAISQWVYNYNPKLPQGLGTGSLYSQNFEPTFEIKNGTIKLIR